MKLALLKPWSEKNNFLLFWSKNFALFILLIFFSSCAVSSAKYSVETLERDRGQTKMVFMPLDLDLYEISVGGVPELKAEWTEKGRKNVSNAVQDFLLGKESISLSQYQSSEDESEAHSQLFRLFGVVGKAIFSHYHNPYNTLPSKKEFQWSLGDSTDVIRDEYGADYALFVRMSDQFSSGGRVALGVVTAMVMLAVVITAFVFMARSQCRLLAISVATP